MCCPTQNVMSTLLFILLAMLPHSMEVEAFNYTSIRDDVMKFNVTCNREHCSNPEKNSLLNHSCHCGVQCVQFGTCCFDSPYAATPQPKLKPACLSIDTGENYFIVDRHPSTDGVWANLCNSEWDGDDDVRKLVPVTSLLTNVTYKNYYCFRSYETTDNFQHWNVELGSDSTEYSASDVEDKQLLLTYDNETKTWMASYDGGNISFDVTLTMRAPPEIGRLLYNCVPRVISDCARNWTDDEVRNKCHSYMGIKAIKGNYVSRYRNVHCALCNYEKLEDIRCRPFTTHSSLTKPLSFTLLLDINKFSMAVTMDIIPSDGEIVGKRQKCSGNQLYDPFWKRCRKLRCALPGYVMKNGKCVRG